MGKLDKFCGDYCLSAAEGNREVRPLFTNITGSLFTLSVIISVTGITCLVNPSYVAMSR